MDQPSGLPKQLRWIAPGVVVLVGAAVVVWLVLRPDPPKRLRLDDYLDRVASGGVSSATIRDADRSVTGELSDGTRYQVLFPLDYADDLTDALRAGQPPIRLDARAPSGHFWTDLATTLIPILVLAGLFLLLMQRFQGGGKANTFGRAKARRSPRRAGKVTFADVAGADEAVEELQEVAEFLRHPSRFRVMGARIPKGVLLYGPPGTGKTLLARAVAGEADANFFSISGSDFVEMFVGVGASRVRDLFQQAVAASPAIVFIDEIDAVGRQRGAGLGGGHDEREQTLNQMLVEMDGFDNRQGVIVLAATNRPDILDPALLRPGRFDRHVQVDLPDRRGRLQILDVHRRGKPLEPGLSLEGIARRTPGFSGADLANVLNEAAILAARRGRERIGAAEVEEAVDRVVAGPARRAQVLSAEERWQVAYHEAGHALVGHLLPTGDPVHKVSIVARGRALGWTMAVPREERQLSRRVELSERMAMLLGGRCAEELVLGDMTTGAADDIERVTQLARSMVTEFGMSDTVGPRRLGHRQGEPFLGRTMGGEADYSDATAALIDAEIEALVETARELAFRLLSEHRATLDRLAEALVARETLDEADLAAIFAGAAPFDEQGGGPASVGASTKPLSNGREEPVPVEARPVASALSAPGLLRRVTIPEERGEA